jgi:DnaK suppressor protein
VPGPREHSEMSGWTADGVRLALAAERADTIGRIDGLTRDRRAILESAESTSTDDEHDPEGATLAFEREQLAALLDQARAHLAELDVAVERLDAGTYGRCIRCGQLIPAERLTARPASVTCVACASRKQLPGLTK